jgi:hypothetical protein
MFQKRFAVVLSFALFSAPVGGMVDAAEAGTLVRRPAKSVERGKKGLRKYLRVKVARRVRGPVVTRELIVYRGADKNNRLKAAASVSLTRDKNGKWSLAAGRDLGGTKGFPETTQKKRTRAGPSMFPRPKNLIPIVSNVPPPGLRPPPNRKSYPRPR